MDDKPRRDIMAPDSEPTDEELALVMGKARDTAVRRRAEGRARLGRQIAEAVEEAMARRRALGK